MRSRTIFLIPVFAILALAGCTGQPAPQSSSDNASASQSPSATPTKPSPSAAPTPTQRADPNAPKGQCQSDNLGVAVNTAGGAAGHVQLNIVFTNKGTAACALQGAPGVSIVGHGNGTQIGVPAKQILSASPATIQLAPGGTAVAQLQAVDIGSGGGPLGDSCKAVTGDGYRIYPPHEFAAIFVPHAGVAACSSNSVWLQVGEVAAG